MGFSDGTIGLAILAILVFAALVIDYLMSRRTKRRLVSGRHEGTGGKARENLGTTGDLSAVQNQARSGGTQSFGAGGF